jgi:hypothetical protein
MNRLQSELHRLYFPLSKAGAEAGTQPSALIDTSGKVRAMVMELRGPPGWDALSRVWQGVQAELGLPAPAIAVSGIDGLQLWFSVAEPIAVAQAHAFLDRLRQRFLSDVEPGRVRLMPALDASALRQELHAAPVPALQESGNWSAFLAPDLVPIFADTPWLDTPPNEEGQASLLRGIEVMQKSAFDAACQKLGPAAPASQSPEAVSVSADKPLAKLRARDPLEPADSGAEAKRFLLQVMNDDTVALALRIEAARALLFVGAVSQAAFLA